MQVLALDAAMPFDYEHKATQTLKKQRALAVAVIGFGTFGQFLAKRLVAAGHHVSQLMTVANTILSLGRAQALAKILLPCTLPYAGPSRPASTKATVLLHKFSICHEQ